MDYCRLQLEKLIVGSLLDVNKNLMMNLFYKPYGAIF